jgi:hypothetical protein
MKMAMFKKKKRKYAEITNIKQIKAHLSRSSFLIHKYLMEKKSSMQSGCVPLSDELFEKEADESDRRVEAISHLIPLLYGSDLFAEAFIALYASTYKPR